MATKVSSNLLSLLHQLEEKNKRRYGWKYIGDRIGRSRQATEAIFMNEQGYDSYIKYGLIGNLIDFFHAEGLEITPGDLFTVTTTLGSLALTAAGTVGQASKDG